MAEEQKQDITNNTEDTVIPPAATTEYIDDTITDIQETITAETELEQVNKEPVQVIVNIPKDENKPAITANRIAIFGTIINIALAGLTYMLFQKTVEANKTSQASLAEAQKAVEQAKRANDIAEANFKLAQISSANNDSINNINLELSKKSVGTQISSIKETQKQFEIANMPYLQCTDFNFKILEPDKRPVINFNTENLGNYPAKITDRKLGYIYLPPPIPKNPYDRVDFSMLTDSWSVYIDKEKPKNENFTATDKLPKAAYDAIKDGKFLFCFFGEITYQNETNGKKRVYSFYINIYPPPSNEYKVIYNKNIDIN